MGFYVVFSPSSMRGEIYEVYEAKTEKKKVNWNISENTLLLLAVYAKYYAIRVILYTFDVCIFVWLLYVLVTGSCTLNNIIYNVVNDD